jgi:hypothetical protein
LAKTLRIFISSPSDVEPERRQVAIVIQELSRDYSRFFDIQTIDWTTEPMLASGHFQDIILPPSETDILVMIVWSRLGTWLPEKTNKREYRGIDGRVPVTGTEWEFEDGLAAQQRHGAPDLLAYRKATEPTVSLKNKTAREEATNQWNKLEEFWGRHFLNRGTFRAAFNEFNRLDEFKSLVERDLRKLIEARAKEIVAGSEGTQFGTWLKDRPFRGLETYRFEDAPIFFGRSGESQTALERLINNGQAGHPFLLLLGPSGTGKSSVAQAGILPLLCTRAVVPGVALWRRAVMRPSGHPAGPFHAMATALTAKDALPELLKGGSVEELASHLENAALDPAYFIIAILRQLEASAKERGKILSYEQAHLMLVVDQLEELFTISDKVADLPSKFVACMQGLMRRGKVFVIATMRTDYWYRAIEVPALVKLADEGGRLDLLPATQPQLLEMIRRPARIAGLTFESHRVSQIGLDVDLADQAAQEPGALPLLSSLLDTLYRRDIHDTERLRTPDTDPGFAHGDGPRDDGAAGTRPELAADPARQGSRSMLTYASMEALGGLKGAIAHRAADSDAFRPGIPT